MKRAVKWSKPSGDEWQPTYYSKCGRFVIKRRRFASGRNGCFNNIGYTLVADGHAQTQVSDTLRDAKDEAEMINNPSWEPE